MSLLTSLSPRDRRALENLAEVIGGNPEEIAVHMVGAYLRLVIDAPAVLPDRPLLGIIRNAKKSSRKGVTLAS